eukprot:2460861-Amphidinium_carterae.2
MPSDHGQLSTILSETNARSFSGRQPAQADCIKLRKTQKACFIGLLDSVSPAWSGELYYSKGRV